MMNSNRELSRTQPDRPKPKHKQMKVVTNKLKRFRQPKVNDKPCNYLN